MEIHVGLHPFSQLIFHTLFFADYYLGHAVDAFRQQAFHKGNLELFGDYEQLEEREPVSVYVREQIEIYGSFCRDKASIAIHEGSMRSQLLGIT